MKVMFLYYNQEQAVKQLQWFGYDKSQFEIIFIDDGSEIPLKCDWATVYRIDKDVAWNQPKANNLGLSKLESDDVVLRMDIDHYFNVNDLSRINQIQVGHKEIITFNRLFRGSPISPHPNIYLTRAKDLIDAGGYDEQFCGNYGYDDSELMHRLKQKGFKFYRSEIYCVADSTLSTIGLNRDIKINRLKYLKAIEKSNL